MGVIKDITGRVFGRLTVIKFHGIRNNRHSMWVCLCECGEEAIVLRPHLIRGITKSCGCYRNHINKTRYKKNDYEVDGIVTKMMIPDYKGNIFICLVDTSKFEKVKDKKWFAKFSGSGSHYVQTVEKNNGNEKTLFIHRVLSDAPKGMVVDHKNHNTFDNRLENLRVCTQSENGQNRRGPIYSSRSGVRNVSWSSRENKWKVAIRCEGKLHYFGHFNDLEEAKKVADTERYKLLPFAT